MINGEKKITFFKPSYQGMDWNETARQMQDQL